jgi:hypothetical protein
MALAVDRNTWHLTTDTVALIADWPEPCGQY